MRKREGDRKRVLLLLYNIIYDYTTNFNLNLYDQEATTFLTADQL